LKCPYLIITAFGDFDTAVKALKEGVSDYLVKPVDEEILLQTIDSYLRHPSPEQELVLNKLGNTVIAQSPSMKAIVENYPG
jgi:DNA-binding NtrC family response regulator